MVNRDSARSAPAWCVSYPAVVLCERSPRWAGRWRATPTPPACLDELRLIETRSLSECRRTLVEHPAALALLSLDVSAVDDVLDVLAWIDRRLPRVAVVVLGESHAAPLDSLVREAGAAALLTSLAELDLLKRLATRHARRRAEHLEISTDTIWNHLPWPRAAGRTSMNPKETP